MKVGIADLPLHEGRAPRWLFRRMVEMGGAIAEAIVYEYDREGLLERLSSPFWLQCFGNVMGWDWDSSGMGTVVSGALKESLQSLELGIRVAGGKGRASRRSPDEIRGLGDAFGLQDERIETLVRASKLSAKVDNAALQDRHQLYHHAFILSEDGSWVVIQQGMNPERGYARRYHWYWKDVKRFDEEPHASVLGQRLDTVLDMTAGKSEGARRASVDMARENPRRLVKFLKSLRRPRQMSLRAWNGEEDPFMYFTPPKRLNWNALRKVYEFQPQNYEELLSMRGVGPATIRALAYASEVIYGDAPSWRDPVRFSFALGGKDGIPYPVNRGAMDDTIEVLKRAVEEARVGQAHRLRVLERLKAIVPP